MKAKYASLVLGAALLLAAAAPASAVVSETPPSLPWLKAGAVLTWKLDMGYDFGATVKALTPDLVFDYKMTNDSGTAGTVTIKEAALKDSTVQHNYFMGGPLTLENETTVWVSKKVYKALKTAEPLVISPDAINETLKFVKTEKYAVTLDGKPAELDVLYGETDKGHKFWILDNPDNPIICKMVISFTIELKDIKSK
jgi:hypothetical protein